MIRIVCHVTIQMHFHFVLHAGRKCETKSALLPNLNLCAYAVLIKPARMGSLASERIVLEEGLNLIKNNKVGMSTELNRTTKIKSG